MTHGYQYLKRVCLLITGIIILTALKKADKLILPGKDHMTWHRGAIIRGDSTQKKMAMVFTGDEFADGAQHIMQKLKDRRIKASFFFTGRFYGNPSFKKVIQKLKKEGHYLGAHSDKHLLYCDWNKRDSLLVSNSEFSADLLANYKRMENFGIRKLDANFFLPPFEWYNDTIAAWTKDLGLQLINYTAGTISHADYTMPSDLNYQPSEKIFQSIINYEKNSSSGLNGFILLLHIGTDPKRTDKFYNHLEDLLMFLERKDYQPVSISELLN